MEPIIPLAVRSDKCLLLERTDGAKKDTRTIQGLGCP